MEGGTKAFDAGLPATGPVELVPSQRGGFKAKYSGRTFTMETHKGTRCHWRCDMRGCKSRLSTDVYGSVHMVYKFKALDEDLHQRATSERKRRRRGAAYKQVHEDTNTTAGEQHDQLPNKRATQKTMLRSYLHQQQEEMQEEPQKKAKLERSAEQKQLHVDQQNKPIAIKSEPVDDVAVVQDIQYEHHVSDSEDDDKEEDDRSTVSANSTNKSIGQDCEKSKASFSDGASDRASDGASDDADQGHSYASAKVKNSAGQKRLFTVTDDEDSDGEADEEHSHEVADHSVSGGTNLKGSRQYSRCAEVLQMTDNYACDNDEQELRSSVLRQMHRLLEAETKLAKQRRRIADLRELLLARQLADLET